MRICTNSPSIHHLLFAHDSLILQVPHGKSATVLKILKTYELASGQVINLHKSSVVFSRNVEEASRKEFTDLFGVECVANLPFMTSTWACLSLLVALRSLSLAL